MYILVHLCACVLFLCGCVHAALPAGRVRVGGGRRERERERERARERAGEQATKQGKRKKRLEIR